MNFTELQAWSERAPAQHVAQVANAATAAREDWQERIERQCELIDLLPWAGGWAPNPDSAHAAAQVAAELWVLVLLYPAAPAALRA